MLILPFAILVGLLAGWVMGGSWRALLDTRLRHSPLVVGAIATQVALELPGVRGWASGFRLALLVVTYLVLGWWLFENARCSSGGARLGFGVVGGGWALNLLVIVTNGGMPVSDSALQVTTDHRNRRSDAGAVESR